MTELFLKNIFQITSCLLRNKPVSSRYVAVGYHCAHKTCSRCHRTITETLQCAGILSPATLTRWSPLRCIMLKSSLLFTLRSRRLVEELHIKLSYPDSPPYETKENVLFDNFQLASFYQLQDSLVGRALCNKHTI